MSDDQLLRQIREWQSRLTGLMASSFEGFDLDRKLELIAQWHASKVIAEQMVVLLVAQAMLEEGTSAKDLAIYVGSREAKGTPLGRFNFVTGIAEWPGMVARVFLPLLGAQSHRPFLRYDTAKSVVDLCTHPSLAGAAVRPDQVADTIYRRGLSPHVAKRTLGTMAAFAKCQPEMAGKLLEALVAVRRQALDTIRDLPQVQERIVGLEASWDAAGPEEGTEAP